MMPKREKISLAYLLNHLVKNQNHHLYINECKHNEDFHEVLNIYIMKVHQMIQYEFYQELRIDY
jgi:hypothetical protein